MTKNYDETIDLAQGGDTGQNNAASTQPLASAENVWADPLNRSPENLRKRTEVLRQALQDSRYYEDYDRALLFQSDAYFQLSEPDPTGDPGRYTLLVTGDDLWIYPALTPGMTSGGRWFGARMFTQNGVNWVPYAGNLGTTDISFVASSVTTGQRGYVDGDNFATDVNSVTLGANRLTIELINNVALVGGAGSISAVVSKDPATHIAITYGSLTVATTINDIIAFINGDVTSQGSYGLSHLIFASTTSVGSSAPPVLTSGTFQGGYDAEAHKVPLASFSAFFGAVDGGGNFINRLRVGESIAISYAAGPVERGPAAPSAKGGRRQSLFDWPSSRTGAYSDNTAPLAAWNLFNTGLEPEKIPGSIPIGKLIRDTFVFADGTRVRAGEMVKLGVSNELLAWLTAAGGAGMIGYNGSPPWDTSSPDGVQSLNTSLPAGNVQDTFDTLVTQLASQIALDGGTRRVGGDVLTGSVTSGNKVHDTPLGTLRHQLDDLLNAPAGVTDGGGINARLSERGGQLHGFDPLAKDFREISPQNLSGGGAKFSQVILNPRTDATGFIGAKQSQAHVILEPIQTSIIGGVAGSAITQSMPINGVVLTGKTRPQLTGKTQAQFTAMMQKLPTTFLGIYDGNGVICEISGLVQGLATDGNGLYILTAGDKTNQALYLSRMNGDPTGGVVNPDFTGANFAAATVTFHLGVIVGNNPGGDRIVASLAGNALLRVGVARVDGTTAGSQMIADFQRAPQDPDTTAPVTGQLFNDRLVFYKYSDGDVAGAVRDTDNILETIDKGLLDGVETGVVVDASLSHNHNSAYLQYPEATSSEVNSTHFTPDKLISDFSAPSDVWTDTTWFSDLPAVPVGFYRQGFVLRLQWKLVASDGAPGVQTSSFSFDIRCDVGTAQQNVTASYVFLHTGGSNEAFTGESTIGLAINPLTTPSQIQIRVNSAGVANIVAGSCTIVAHLVQVVHQRS